MSDKCEGALLIFEKEMNTNINHDVVAAHDCEEDVSKFCSDLEDTTGEGLVLACLKANRENLGAKCKSDIDKKTKISLAHFSLVPSIHTACQSDMKQLCENIEEDTHGSSYECLEKHLNQASPKCQQELFKQDQVTLGTGDYKFLRKVTKLIIEILTKLQ